ncbi:hypothetical protein UFOVP276_226 [uncultured Caudovirales phage]|uniref:Uncharacterized protein n=1 Tax=uncultured Caudovirales phage TaxID=2100421 RepID=A0A6J5LDQ2_9CAUD|nr:hypothetical protein UFOVP127_120 [uncultured Caudovirales phage]CAB4135270.1 hypothetical protein UFOVP276_226 [uncultured Caudovirales phage]
MYIEKQIESLDKDIEAVKQELRALQDIRARWKVLLAESPLRINKVPDWAENEPKALPQLCSCGQKQHPAGQGECPNHWGIE